MDIYMKDVLNQTEAVSNAVKIYFSEDYIKTVSKIIGSFKVSRCSNIYFTGMGSSYHSAYGAALFLNVKGIRAFVKPSSEFLYYGLNFLKEEDAVIIISQSGGSAEIVKLANELNKKNFKNVLLVTNNETCVTCKNVEKILAMHLEPETFVATRTYLCSVIINLFIAYTIAGEKLKSLKNSVDSIMNDIASYLKDYESNSEKLGIFIGETKHIEFLGRGPGYGSALVSALCMKEYCKISSEALELGNFKHGPIEIVNKDFRAFVFAPKGITYDISINAARDLVQKGAKVVLITDSDPEIEDDNMMTICLKGGNEFLSQVRDFVPHQLLNKAFADKFNVCKDGWNYVKKVTDVE